METRKLPAADRPREWYRYHVTGVGNVPMDMLRYDAAYPLGSYSVSRILGTERRTVELASYRKPTVDRWASFGWVVA